MFTMIDHIMADLKDQPGWDGNCYEEITADDERYKAAADRPLRVEKRISGSNVFSLKEDYLFSDALCRKGEVNVFRELTICYGNEVKEDMENFFGKAACKDKGKLPAGIMMMTIPRHLYDRANDRLTDDMNAAFTELKACSRN